MLWQTFYDISIVPTQRASNYVTGEDSEEDEVNSQIISIREWVLVAEYCNILSQSQPDLVHLLYFDNLFTTINLLAKF